MTKKEIKEIVAHLTHVKQVWVKNNEIFIHYVKGAEHFNLDDEEKIIPEKPKKSK